MHSNGIPFPKRNDPESPFATRTPALPIMPPSSAAVQIRKKAANALSKSLFPAAREKSTKSGSRDFRKSLAQLR
jgi:hypothetical protein